MKKLVIIIAISLSLAIIFSYKNFNKSTEEFKKEVIGDYTKKELKEGGIYQEKFLTNLSLEQIEAFNQFGLEGVEVVKNYPEETKILFENIGGMPEFREIFRQYGYHEIIPVLWWHWKNDHQDYINSVLKSDLVIKTVNYFSVQGTFNEYCNQPPIVRVGVAILKIKELGLEYLARFEYLKKTSNPNSYEAKPHNINTIISMGSNFLLGGVKNYESKILKGEQISTKDQFEAGLDIALLFGPALLKWFGRTGEGAKATRGIVEIQKSSKFYRTVATLAKIIPYKTMGKFAGYGLIGYGGYLLLRNPLLANKTFAFIVGDLLGITPVYCQLIFWALYFFIAGYLMVLILKLLKFIYKIIRVVIDYCLTIKNFFIFRIA